MSSIQAALVILENKMTDYASVENIVNLFLYGSLNTPVDLEERLRDLPTDKVIRVDVDAISFMKSVGRFAHAGAAAIIGDFFSGDLSSSLGNLEPDGSIRVSVRELLNIDSAFEGKTRFSISQYETGTFESDYAYRSFIWGGTSYTLSPETTFVWDASGQHIDNLAVVPFDTDFDFKSNNGLANAVNVLLQEKIDPQQIGRTLDLKFTASSKLAWKNASAIDGYDANSYAKDVAKLSLEHSSMTQINLIGYYDALIGLLETEGIVEYERDGRPILYDSPRVDEIEAPSQASIIIAGAGNDRVQGSAFEDEIYGGGGADTIFGGNGDDVIYGGDGDDILMGGEGADTLSGGSGRDLLVGGHGDDTFYQSTGGDQIDGGSGSNTLYLSAEEGLIVDVGSSAAGTTHFRNIERFVASDLYTTFYGNSGRSSTFVAGLGGATFYLTAGDAADGNKDSVRGNSYYVSSKDAGSIVISNFKKNDRLYVDGKLITNVTITSRISQGSVYDVTGENKDIYANAVGVQTRISGSLSGTFNSLKYLAPDQSSNPDGPGEYESGLGTASTTLNIWPGEEEGTFFQFADPSGGQGLRLSIYGFQDGYGGIKLKADLLSLAIMSGKYTSLGSYERTGDIVIDNRNKFYDAYGEYEYSSQLYSPYDAVWDKYFGRTASGATISVGGEAEKLTAASNSDEEAQQNSKVTLVSNPAISTAPVTGKSGGDAIVSGSGGADTFYFERGSGVLRIDEQDGSSRPANLLALGDGITSDDVTAYGNEQGDIIIDVGGGDKIIILGGLLPRDSSGITRGIQSITFTDGSAWSFDDLIYATLNPSSDIGLLVGNAQANDIDSGGVVSRVIGNGGGDTFWYEEGYGLLYLDEVEKVSGVTNRLVLGGAIQSQHIQVIKGENGDLIVRVSDSDQIVLTGMLNTTQGSRYGVQEIEFSSDGVVWNYEDIIARAGSTSVVDGFLLGTSHGEILDSLGEVHTIVGGGGGDTIIFNKGYGSIVIDEADNSTDPNNSVVFGEDFSLSEMKLSRTGDGSLIISFYDDELILKRALTDDLGISYGLQRFQFADGTVLSYADIMARASSAVSSDVIFGDSKANVFDPMGTASLIIGGGGGDTFVYNRGYGPIVLDQTDNSTGLINLIAFGPGISAEDVRFTGDTSGNILIDIGAGDTVLLKNALMTDADKRFGVQLLSFHVGGNISYDDILTRLSAPADSSDTIYGDAGSNVLDTYGVAVRAVGFGGGDTFIYKSGYGRLIIDQKCVSGMGANTLLFGTGISATALAVRGMANGDIILDAGGNDTILIVGGFNRFDQPGEIRGIDQIVFDDGTIWSFEDIVQKAVAWEADDAAIFGSQADNIIDTLGLTHFVDGKRGNDTYIFNEGYGPLYINETRSIDKNKMVFGAGLTFETLKVSSNFDGDLVLSFAGDDVITVAAALLISTEMHENSAIDTFVFSDGTTKTYQDILAKLHASSFSETGNTYFGSANSEVIYADPQYSRIVANGGSDTIYYSAGNGHVRIDQLSSVNSETRLIFDDHHASSARLNGTIEGDIVITFAEGDSVTISGQLNGGGRGVDVVEFADGKSWNRDDLEAFLLSQISVDPASDSEVIDLTRLPISFEGSISLRGVPGQASVFLSSDLTELTIYNAQSTLYIRGITAAASENILLKFEDGVEWQISDALANVSNLDEVDNVLFGNEFGEVFDPVGHVRQINTGGGGDIIRYSRGYGNLELNASESQQNGLNKIILSPDLNVEDLTVYADDGEQSTLVLDFGSDDQIKLVSGIHVSSASRFGIQNLVFSDGRTLTYFDLISMADRGSEANRGTLIGDSYSNEIDTRGFSHSVVGNGGGDVIWFKAGYGLLSLDQRDTSPDANNILRLGEGLSAASAVVTGDGDSISIRFPGSDEIWLKGALLSSSSLARGVQSVIFADGTMWTAGHILQKLQQPRPGFSTIFGDVSANVLDPGGIAHHVYGNGGGDVILYNRGYGNVVIEELDYSDSPLNVLRFGPEILPSDIIATMQGSGSFKLDLVGGGSVSFQGTNSSRDQYLGAALGIQRVEFADGTSWTYEQLLAIADAPVSGRTLYGDVNANRLDPNGVVHSISGAGGGDTIVYAPGYGLLTITEETGSGIANIIEFQPGIDPNAIRIGSYNGNLYLDINQNDRIIIGSSGGFGIDEMRFSDGTVWNSSYISDLRFPTSNVGDPFILPSSQVTSSIIKVVGAPSDPDLENASGRLLFHEKTPNSSYQAVITNVSQQSSSSSVAVKLPLESLRSWLSLEVPQVSENGNGEVLWTFDPPAGALDFLKPGDFASVSFLIQLRDSHGNAYDQIAKVYLNGVNVLPSSALPVVSDTSILSKSLEEIAEQTASSSSLFASGKISASDAIQFRSTGAVVVAVSVFGDDAGLPSYSEMMDWLTLGSLVPSSQSGLNIGTTTWGFVAPDKHFDYLSVGQSVSLTYEVEIADQAGNFTRVPIVIGVIGSNDVPQIDFSEPHTTSSEIIVDDNINQSVVTATGSFVVNDADGDFLSVNVLSVSIIAAGEPEIDTFALLGSLNVSLDSDSGIVSWQFGADSSIFSSISYESSVAVTYVVQVADLHGAFFDQEISIDITKAFSNIPNSGPTISSPSFVEPELDGIAAISDLVVIDPDARQYSTVTLIAARGRLKVVEDGEIFISGNDSRALTITGNIDNLNVALSTLTYERISSGTDEILVTADDGEVRSQKVIEVTNAGAGNGAVLSTDIVTAGSSSVPEVSSTFSGTARIDGISNSEIAKRQPIIRQVASARRKIGDLGTSLRNVLEEDAYFSRDSDNTLVTAGTGKISPFDSGLTAVQRSAAMLTQAMSALPSAGTMAHGETYYSDKPNLVAPYYMSSR